MTKKQSAELRDELREYMSSIGRLGGKARTQQMTPEERKALARKAAKARWDKKR